MGTTVEGSVFKLALDSNSEVWVIEGDRMPYSTKLTVEGYIDKLETSGNCPDKIRVLGSGSNAGMIVRLYRLKVKHRLKSLEIGSPIIVSNNDAPANLIKMRMASAIPSLGGWHEADMLDCASYGVGALIRSETEGSHIKACELMKQHPVRNYVSFIPHIDDMFFTKVMARIGDPRWYIDPNHPSRLSRLYSWLGLCNGPQTDDKLVKKFDVYSCWSKGLSASISEMARPGWFIIREGSTKWANHKPWVSSLRMSQLFIKFVRMAWMDSIYPYPNPWMEKVFDPDLFFSQEKDSIGLAIHLSKLK